MKIVGFLNTRAGHGITDLSSNVVASAMMMIINFEQFPPPNLQSRLLAFG